MRLYHGSTVPIERPDIKHSRENLDFGRGFYLTSHKDQAERWALRRAAFDESSAIVSIYRMDEDIDGLRVLKFERSDEDWVEFVCACRRGGVPVAPYDIIIGGVADDKVFEAVNMYFKGYWDMQTTLEALRFYDHNDQYCFATQRAIDQALRFEDSYEVRP